MIYGKWGTLTEATIQYTNRKKIKTLINNEGISSSFTSTLFQVGAILLLSPPILCLSVFSPSYMKYKCILSQFSSSLSDLLCIWLYLVGYRVCSAQPVSSPLCYEFGVFWSLRKATALLFLK